VRHQHCCHCGGGFHVQEQDTTRGTVAGGFFGALIGRSMGVALLGTAISGLVPLALLGAYLGHQAHKRANLTTCPHCFRSTDA
jgi:hypothetical protein